MRELRGAFILEPRSGARLDMGFAAVQAATYNVHRKKNANAIDPNDLIPDYWDPERFEFEAESVDEIDDANAMTPNEIADMLRARFGATKGS